METIERILDGNMKPTDLPLATLRQITDNFSENRIIGSGGFGTVYKGVLRNGNVVAVKRIRSHMTVDEKPFRREVGSLIEVDHQNIVKFIGFCSHTVETTMENPETQKLILVEIRERLLCFEYMSNGSLERHITDELRGLEWDIRYKVIKGICMGLYYLHTRKNILHMDLKPANILLDNQMDPKITDFGQSRPSERSQTTSLTHFATLGYSAPENWSGGGRMTPKSDIHSLGVIIIEIVTGRKDMPGDKNNILRRWKHRWNKSRSETPLAYQQQVMECIELGIKCRSIEPCERPPILDIMTKVAKIGSMNNHTRNVDEPTIGQTRLASWKDDMLGVEPLELRFANHDHNNKLISSCSIELNNNTNDFIAFNIQTTSLFPYCIEPNNSIVPPRSMLSVNITSSETIQYHDKQYPEQFIVQSTKVDEKLAAKDIQDMFDKGNKYVDKVDLEVVYEVCNVPQLSSNEEAIGGTVPSHNSRRMPSGGGSNLASVVGYIASWVGHTYKKFLPTPVRMPTHFNSRTLITITNNFSDDQRVGGGYYADVYKAVYDGEEIAVKYFHATKGIDDLEFMKTVGNHMNVQHPNIVQLVGYCNEVSKKYFHDNGEPPRFGRFICKVLCSEYMQGRSLEKRLSGNSLGDDWHTHYQIIKGTCEGLCYLHCGCGHPILHLDLKPANILLDNLMNPKIADFGLSRIYVTNRAHAIDDSVERTMKYMPPELIHQREMSVMTDIFSLGVTMLDVIKGSKSLGLSHDVSETNFVQDVLTYWNNRDRTANLEQVEACTITAIRCVDPKKKNRPTIEEIMAILNGMETQVLSKGLHTLTVNSSSGTFRPLPIFNSERGPLDVVIVYAFDCSAWTPAWYAMDKEIFWLVQGKLGKFTDSCMGYIYVMLSGNTYTYDMKIVDSAETSETGYTPFARRRVTCYKNMASGLSEAHNMISNRGYDNGIILLFSDGLEYKGDFFQGAENFASKVPVHTFTFDEGDAYNHVLCSIAAKSLGGRFHTTPVPERPSLSTAFSRLLDNIFGGNPEYDEIPPSPISGRGPLDVVIVYAFDCTDSTPAWHTMDNGVFWLVQEKLTNFPDSCMGSIYVMSTDNTYTSEMKLVDPDESKATGYTAFARRRLDCTKNMASGLPRAHKMIRNRGHRNGIVLFFSDGLINKGDFFDGTENFISKVPVHTFTLGGDAYNHGLQAIAKNSPGGTFNPVPVPERPQLSANFSKVLDSLFNATMRK